MPAGFCTKLRICRQFVSRQSEAEREREREREAITLWDAADMHEDEILHPQDPQKYVNFIVLACRIAGVRGNWPAWSEVQKVEYGIVWVTVIPRWNESMCLAEFQPCECDVQEPAVAYNHPWISQFIAELTELERELNSRAFESGLLAGLPLGALTGAGTWIESPPPHPAPLSTALPPGSHFSLL